MIRLLMLVIILSLVLALVRTFMNGSSKERPIDVKPVEDDIIDVEPVVEEKK